MENETNLNIKNKILQKTEETKNTYINNLETIENQNELIEQNYNKVVDINDQLKESSSIIRKIKRSICDCFKSKPRIKNDNMNKIIITNNNNSEIKEKKHIENDNFENKLLNELDDIHNLSKIQNQQITNQNKILNKMNNNTNIVNSKIKKNHNEIKNI